MCVGPVADGGVRKKGPSHCQWYMLWSLVAAVWPQGAFKCPVVLLVMGAGLLSMAVAPGRRVSGSQEHVTWLSLSLEQPPGCTALPVPGVQGSVCARVLGSLLFCWV